MENEQFGNQLTRSEIQADKEWSEFERDLDILGRQLAALQVHAATLGTDLVSSLEARFNEVKTRAQNLQQARQAELDQVRQTAWQHARQAESAFSEVRMRSTEAVRQVWERSEPLRRGAKDVGEGLASAWTELRASFGKAAGRLHTESTAPRDVADLQGYSAVLHRGRDNSLSAALAAPKPLPVRAVRSAWSENGPPATSDENGPVPPTSDKRRERT